MKISVEVWRMSNEPGLIHLASSDGKTFHGQVTSVEGNAGYYPYLYGKLERMLQASGEESVVPKAGQWLAYEEVIQRHLTCSFCGRTREAVRKLISGPRGVYICDECIDLCNEILDED